MSGPPADLTANAIDQLLAGANVPIQQVLMSGRSGNQWRARDGDRNVSVPNTGK